MHLCSTYPQSIEGDPAQDWNQQAGQDANTVVAASKLSNLSGCHGASRVHQGGGSGGHSNSGGNLRRFTKNQMLRTATSTQSASQENWKRKLLQIASCCPHYNLTVHFIKISLGDLTTEALFSMVCISARTTTALRAGRHGRRAQALVATLPEATETCILLL